MEPICRVRSRVVVQVTGPSPEGLPVVIEFEMKRKNSFVYMVFVDASGFAQVSGQELLRLFDEEGSMFIMDYDNPRGGLTGRITAYVMDSTKLAGAIEVYNSYRKYLQYPTGYEENLRTALARGYNARDFHVDVEAF